MLVLAVVSTRPAFAQTAPSGTSTVAMMIVIDAGGRLLPFDQFEARVDANCPGAAGAASPAYFRTRSRGPAVALDLAEVPDPAPSGCGFGLTTPNTPGAALIRQVEVTPAQVSAWTQRTGIVPTVIAVERGPGALGTVVPEPVPTATPSPFAADRAAAAEAGRRFRVALGVALPLALVLALLAGVLVSRRARRLAEAVQEDAAAIEEAPLDERLALAHRGLVEEPPDVPVQDDADLDAGAEDEADHEAPEPVDELPRADDAREREA